MISWIREHWKQLAGFALSLVILYILFKTSDLKQVAQGFERFPYRLLPLLFGLIALREAVRVVEWRVLLHHVGIRASWPDSVVSLLAGDAGQIIPGGIYASNAVLVREEDTNIARSLSATLTIQLLEAFLCLAVLTAVGVNGWPWLRPLAAVVLLGFAGFIFLVTRPATIGWLEQRAEKRKLIGRILHGVKQFLQGMEGMLEAPILAKAGSLAAAHLACTIAALYVITQGMGLHQVHWTQAAAIYSFVLAVVNLNPLPTDLGVSEGSGMSIFLANGVPQGQGLTAMLLVRFSVILFTFVLFGASLLIWREQARRLKEGPKEDKQEKPAGPDSRVTAPVRPADEETGRVPTN